MQMFIHMQIGYAMPTDDLGNAERYVSLCSSAVLGMQLTWISTIFYAYP